MSKSVVTWVNPHNLPLPSFKDPRVPIARHIEWVKSYSNENLFSLPEPDNYNRATLSLRGLECKFIKDQVFYRDITTDNWWTVYYVPDSQTADFDQWIRQQPFLLSWQIAKASKIRPIIKLLHARKNSDVTDNERLFQMGYYAKLGSKYFSEDDTMLLDRLGPARADILKDVEEV
jgi:hypothetical protein